MTTTSPPDDRTLNPALLDLLITDQRPTSVKGWNRVPTHVREIAFGLNGPDWTLDIITQLSGILADYPVVFSKSSTDLGSCSPLRIRFRRTTLRLNHAYTALIPRPSRNLARSCSFNLAGDLHRHRTPPWASPVVVVLSGSRSPTST